MGVRMADIAEDLGVSLMTVSKALRHHSDISEKTRKRVIRRARERGYEPNWMARGLATRRTHVVGLVIPDLMHSFFAEIAKGVASVLDPAGYQVTISNSDENPANEERQISTLIARSVDGFLIGSAERDSGGAKIFKSLRIRKIPYVLFDRLPASAGAHYVGVDDEEVGRLATEHLIEQGCRTIVHLRGHEVSTGVDRVRGYRKALARHGFEFSSRYVIRAGNKEESGVEAMRKLLRLTPRPDGVFCYNDAIAACAIRVALEAGLRVPSDIAIIGSGNFRHSDFLCVPLSSVHQSSLLIGRKSAELLIEIMGSEETVPARRILIPPRLVVRESSLRTAK
ncbi:MAG: LacI family DNA-binding transcriptional regulator [Candidatus Solibacter sp.]|nr:LacI family DNA-binding transcriptional regulator [Candidatus Solibacter sp.]